MNFNTELLLLEDIQPNGRVVYIYDGYLVCYISTGVIEVFDIDGEIIAFIYSDGGEYGVWKCSELLEYLKTLEEPLPS
jgi:hypothetical protein